MIKAAIQAAMKLCARIIPMFTLLACSLFINNGTNAAELSAKNLLSSACHFTTDYAADFPSMLDHIAQADCETPPSRSHRVVWLSLDIDAVKPLAGTDYTLAIYRHWVERAIIQFHYTDGFMLDYDVGSHAFDQYWSVGNYVSFPAPARDVPVSHILVGLQNASSIKLFQQISFVNAAEWEDQKTDGLLLTMVITGILLAMLFYNIALAAVLRFNFHLHYCMVVLAALVYNLSAYGFISYLLPGVISHGTQMNITILALGLNGLAGILFLCSFLEKGVLSPRWKMSARAIGYIFFGLSIVYVNMRGPYTELLELGLHITSFLGVVIVLAALIRAIRNKSQAAIFYAVGWFLPVVGVLARNLREFGLIPQSEMVAYAVSVGIALETIIFAIGIAHRISKIREDRDQAKIASAHAHAASQAKSNFVAHMSHEIRNPIHAIIVLSELTALTELDKRQRQYIQSIQKSGNVLLSLLDDTLDFSKIEAGKVTVEKIAFNPKVVLENVEAVINSKVKEKGLSFIVEGENNIPPLLLGDPTRLSQILINLANNAVKFTAQGVVTLAFTVDTTSDTSLILQGRVTDTGIGMTEEQVSRLFQSYSQADDSVTREYGGTGLGLAICKQLMGLMGGTIGVESKLGEGSCFYFEIPFDLPEIHTVLSNSELKSIQTEGPLETPPSFKGAKILVVEDHQINQLLVSKMLEKTGAGFDIASGGYEAIDMVKTTQYDLILIDLNMPDMNGIEATKVIRSLPKGADTPIIAMTGSADAETRQTCLDAGMNDHLTKPFKPITMLAILEKWLSDPLAI